MSSRKLKRGEGGVFGRVSRRKVGSAGLKNRKVEDDFFMASYVWKMAESVSSLANAF